MSISSCCKKCDANITTPGGGWDAKTFAGKPSTETDTGWDMPAAPDYNQLNWIGTGSACNVDWTECSTQGKYFAGFQDKGYGGINNGDEVASGCTDYAGFESGCLTGKHVLCADNQINTCPGVEVFGDGGFDGPTADQSKIVYKKTDNGSFADVKRGKTICSYPKDAVKKPLQMKTVTQLITNGKIDPVVGDALATTYCTQLVPYTPVCDSIITLKPANTPPGLYNGDTMSKYYGISNIYTGFMGEFVPWTTRAEAEQAVANAATKKRLILWVFQPLASVIEKGIVLYNVVWSSITGPPIKTGQYNDTPSYGIMVWSTAEPNMAQFKLNMSSIPVPGVPLATINWALSPPNKIDTEFTATKWTEPPVLFYAPPLDSSPRCNTIQFIVSAWIDKPGYVGNPPDPSTDPTKIDKMMIWGAAIASAPPIINEVCMDSPITGQPMDQCSRFRAKGAGGDACREWAISRKVVGVNTAPDKAYEAYCNSNSANADCDCLKRNQAIASKDEPIRDRYNAVQIPVPDTCWFGPCKDNDGNYSVVTESILNPNPAVKTCPDDVCIQVVEAWAKRDASIDNVDGNELRERVHGLCG